MIIITIIMILIIITIIVKQKQKISNIKTQSKRGDKKNLIPLFWKLKKPKS